MDLGVGSRPIPRKNLTAESLAQAITQVTTDPAIRDQAARLGEKLRAEDGADQAAAIIHQYLKG